MRLIMAPQAIEARKSRIRAIALRDASRFKPNPLGPGYLTRAERYQSLIWSLERRRQGMFAYHNCWKCKNGASACVGGNPNCCEYPHARND